MNHTRTRTDSRRGRIAARETERDARRARLRLLLARADRGVLSPEDCAALRADIEAEVVECDTHRRSAGGQQAAAMRLHHTLTAAEDAIREIETERDEHATEAAALRAQLTARTTPEDHR
ncbi:hypothetical protein [Streptomyces xanthochromogenes]|uniref:Uncharacterized protein n=1 Tax=Streptomyces xanthochromogenes TaxID=67384 RepID=A0ABQ3AVK1_9ACTN|nr:hypothetical protein [Streptomyces xanthochromogenes]GGY65521.1 hypothetical protein GCM10010326_70150 [Streptomyces xanthochromogenes]